MNTTTIYQGLHPAITPAGMGKKKTRQSHFEIYTLEWLHQQYLLQEDKQERLELYEITWFKSGAGVVGIDSKSYEVKSNSVYCFVPGQMRHYNIKGDINGYRVSFTPDFLCTGIIHSRIATWLDQYDSDRAVPVMEADADMLHEMEDIIRKMQKEFSNYNLLRSEILAGLLNILMIYFSRKLQVTASDICFSKETELVRRFKALVKEHFIATKSVTNYAGELCVTPNYLNRTVKRITGFTASHYIQQHIILEAKRRAANSNISMKEIAYGLGFDNLAHFSKFFKNNCGVNFTSFKRNIQSATL